MICDDDCGGKEKVRSSGSRSFQERGAVMDMALLENVRWEVREGRERVRQEDNWVMGRASWLNGEKFVKVSGLGVLQGVVG